MYLTKCMPIAVNEITDPIGCCASRQCTFTILFSSIKWSPYVDFLPSGLTHFCGAWSSVLQDIARKGQFNVTYVDDQGHITPENVNRWTQDDFKSTKWPIMGDGIVDLYMYPLRADELLFHEAVRVSDAVWPPLGYTRTRLLSLEQPRERPLFGVFTQSFTMGVWMAILVTVMCVMYALDMILATSAEVEAERCGRVRKQGRRLTIRGNRALKYQLRAQNTATQRRRIGLALRLTSTMLGQGNPHWRSFAHMKLTGRLSSRILAGCWIVSGAILCWIFSGVILSTFVVFPPPNVVDSRLDLATRPDLTLVIFDDLIGAASSPDPQIRYVDYHGYMTVMWDVITKYSDAKRYVIQQENLIGEIHRRMMELNGLPGHLSEESYKWDPVTVALSHRIPARVRRIFHDVIERLHESGIYEKYVNEWQRISLDELEPTLDKPLNYVDRLKGGRSRDGRKGNYLECIELTHLYGTLIVVAVLMVFSVVTLIFD